MNRIDARRVESELSDSVTKGRARGLTPQPVARALY